MRYQKPELVVLAPASVAIEMVNESSKNNFQVADQIGTAPNNKSTTGAYEADE